MSVSGQLPTATTHDDLEFWDALANEDLVYFESFGVSGFTRSFIDEPAPTINMPDGKRKVRRVFVNTSITKSIYVNFIDRKNETIAHVGVFADKTAAVNFFKGLAEHIDKHF
jgi:hypothetical protein